MISANLFGLVAAFSVSHIGLSAVREPLIDQCGIFAGRVGLVGRGLELPDFWLADTSGYEFWPDEATAGRQVYRAAYTIVASALLFPALVAYPEVRAAEDAVNMATALPAPEWWTLFAVASGAQGISVASLFQPSPLSLVPGFTPNTGVPLGLKRDDRTKLVAAGLTRITRHPLILPVVPWGGANMLLTGRHPADVALFAGLSAYAVAGCFAQDLRVEASAQVGTVFEDEEGGQGGLARFYLDTSFLPFGAVVDGRQSFQEALREVPAAAVWTGLFLGCAIEWGTLSWIGVQTP